MDNKTFLRIFGEIDDKFIQQANEDVNYWEGSRMGVSVCPGNTRRPVFRAAVLSAACTAAVMLGVFALLLNMGIVGKIEKIEISEGPASSGAEISNSSEDQNIVINELPFEAILYEDAVYAYEDSNSDVLKRYEVGDMFGEHRLLSARTTYYKFSDGVQIRKKQEITVGGRFLFDLSEVHYSTDGLAYLEIDVGTLQKLGLPSFSKDFDEDMLSYYPTDGRSSADDTVRIGFTELNITVNYVNKTLTVIAQNILDIYD